jgi:hypothetical protein
MRRLASGLCALAIVIAIVATIGFLVEEPALADLDPRACSSQTQVLTARQERVRMVIPRNWCASDHPSYPGVLVSIVPAVRNAPPGEILLTAEPFTRQLYCSWSVACRTQASNTAKYACGLREKLAAARLRVGPAQLGPKENEVAGLPSMWFEFDDGKRFLRQAIAVTGDRALSLVLTTPTADARTSHARPFDQALRTLQILTAAESVAPTGTVVDAGVVAPPNDAPDKKDEPHAGSGNGSGSGSAAPPVRINPIGDCPR